MNLNLPAYDFKLRQTDGRTFIFDSWRKRYVALTPEEWVRQHFLRFLVEEKHFPAGLIAVEKPLIMNGMQKRCDAIVYNAAAQPLAIIELKAPHIRLSQAVFDQVAVYNSRLHVDYFFISNGREHYACKVDVLRSTYQFFSELPDYEKLL